MLRIASEEPPKSKYANVAQSVEQLIRNQQVVCSSHITSSNSLQVSHHLRRVFLLPHHIIITCSRGADILSFAPLFHARFVSVSDGNHL